MIRQSLSDQRLIDELQKGRESLLFENSSRTLLSALRRRLQSITSNMYILNWIAEQGEDLYDVLVDASIVVHIEIPRVGNEAEDSFKTWSVSEYIKAHKDMPKPQRRKLEMALRLAAGDKA